MTALRRTVEGLAVFVFIAVLAASVQAVLSGCSASQTARRATIVGAYELELDGCTLRGREAGSYQVYEACADEVDRRFGLAKEHER